MSQQTLQQTVLAKRKPDSKTQHASEPIRILPSRQASNHEACDCQRGRGQGRSLKIWNGYLVVFTFIKWTQIIESYFSANILCMSGWGGCPALPHVTSGICGPYCSVHKCPTKDRRQSPHRGLWRAQGRAACCSHSELLTQEKLKPKWTQTILKHTRSFVGRPIPYPPCITSFESDIF